MIRRATAALSPRDRLDDLLRRTFSSYWLVRAPGVLGGVTGRSKTTLEIGCGNGNWSPVLAPRAEHLVALDLLFDRARITHSHCRLRGISNVHFLCASGDSLPLPSHTFDTVFCIDVVEHIQDDVKAVAEIARVLRPDGHAVVTTLLLDRPTYLKRFEFSDHLREYSPEEFFNLFEKAGLVRIHTFTFYSLFSTIARELEMMSANSVGRIPVIGVALRASLSLLSRLDRLGRIGRPSGIGVVVTRPRDTK